MLKYKKVFHGDDKLKKLSGIPIIRITVIVLLIAALISACFSSNQSAQSFCIQGKFQGEYSLDNGETWQALPENPHIPAEYGSVILKGGFGSGFPEGFHFNLYLDHIAMEIFLNGEQIYLDSRVEIGLDRTNCAKEWLHWTAPEISENDVLEIRLTNFHRFGNRNAYNEFLDNIYFGYEEIFTTFMLKSGQLYRIVGISLMAAGLMLLAAALFFKLMNIEGGRLTGNLGALALFFGGYIALDTVDLSLWSWLNAFNTYALQISVMLAATCAAACIAENIHSAARKTAKAAVYASEAVNGVLGLLSVFNVTVIYDTLPFWFFAHIVIYAVLLGCCIYECVCKKVTDHLFVISDILLITAAFADIVCYFSGMTNAGICSKCVFVGLFLVHLVRIIRVIPMNYKAAREAEQLKAELAENRISIMLSQIQPHFLYNCLNTIYGLCERDPSAAKKAVNDFADYLRGNMDSLTKKCPVSFETEEKLLRAYLSLEKMRFKSKLEIVWDIQASGFMLPSLTVQPLVENAVKHGICKAEDGGRVTISTREFDDSYEIEVSDNGVGFDVNVTPDDGRSHLGIENVRNRLWKMCGATLELSSEIGRGTSAVIRLPKEKGEKHENNCR